MGKHGEENATRSIGGRSRGYEAGIALKAGTAAALIADYERKAVAGRIPYLDRLDGSNDATELHDAPRITAHAIKS